MAPQISRRVVRIIGYTAFFLVVFLIFLVWRFPVDRFDVVLERQLSKVLERDVVIGELGMTITGGVVFYNMEIAALEENNPKEHTLKNEPNTDKKGPKNHSLTYLIDELTVDVGLIDLLLDQLDLEIDVELFGGTLSIDYEGPLPSLEKNRPLRKRPRSRRPVATGAKEEGEEEEDDDDDEEIPISLRVEAEGISIKRLHDLREKIPVPIAGILGLSVNIESKDGRFATSSGRIDFGLEDVTLSRKGFEAEMFDMKMAVPPLAIASLKGEIALENGEGTVARFKTKSKHFDLGVEGSIRLGDPFSRSQFDLYITFKVLKDYINASDSIKTIVSSLDMFSSEMKRAHRDDGYYGFRYRGAPGKGSFTASKQYTPPTKAKGLSSNKKSSRKSKRKSRRSNRRRSERSSVPPKKSPPTVITTPPGPPSHVDRNIEPNIVDSPGERPSSGIGDARKRIRRSRDESEEARIVNGEQIDDERTEEEAEEEEEEEVEEREEEEEEEEGEQEEEEEEEEEGEEEE